MSKVGPGVRKRQRPVTTRYRCPSRRGVAGPPVPHRGLFVIVVVPLDRKPILTPQIVVYAITPRIPDVVSACVATRRNLKSVSCCVHGLHAGP